MSGQVVLVSDKQRIEEQVRRNAFLHLYEIGDLDDFFWPHTKWYGLEKQGIISQIALLYDPGKSLPVLLALGEEPDLENMGSLLGKISEKLPKLFYAHLSPGLQPFLQADFRHQAHGLHDKMGLVEPAPLKGLDDSRVFQLKPVNLDEIQYLYKESYPGNWFDERMLQTGQYFGIRAEGRLASIAGVHVYSPTYKVAALGNITTHPKFRGKGLAALVIAGLCRELLKTVDHIGLNVKSDNRSAIACYKKLGFRRTASYEEFVFVRNEKP